MWAFASCVTEMYLHPDVAKPRCCKVCASPFLDVVERRSTVEFFTTSRTKGRGSDALKTMPLAWRTATAHQILIPGF